MGNKRSRCQEKRCCEHPECGKQGQPQEWPSAFRPLPDGAGSSPEMVCQSCALRIRSMIRRPPAAGAGADEMEVDGEAAAGRREGAGDGPPSKLINTSRAGGFSEGDVPDERWESHYNKALAELLASKCPLLTRNKDCQAGSPLMGEAAARLTALGLGEVTAELVVAQIHRLQRTWGHTEGDFWNFYEHTHRPPGADMSQFDLRVKILKLQFQLHNTREELATEAKEADKMLETLRACAEQEKKASGGSTHLAADFVEQARHTTRAAKRRESTNVPSPGGDGGGGWEPHHALQAIRDLATRLDASQATNAIEVIAEQLAELQKESDKLTGELVLNAMRAQRALENFDVTPGVIEAIVESAAQHPEVWKKNPFAVDQMMTYAQFCKCSDRRRIRFSALAYEVYSSLYAKIGNSAYSFLYGSGHEGIMQDGREGVRLDPATGGHLLIMPCERQMRYYLEEECSAEVGFLYDNAEKYAEEYKKLQSQALMAAYSDKSYINAGHEGNVRDGKGETDLGGLLGDDEEGPDKEARLKLLTDTLETLTLPESADADDLISWCRSAFKQLDVARSSAEKTHLSRVAKRDKVRAKVLKKLRKKGHAFDTFQAARESTDPAVVNVLHKEAVVLLEQEQTIAASEAVSSGLNKVADMVLEVAGLPSDAPALREALSSGSALPAFERSAPAAGERRAEITEQIEHAVEEWYKACVRRTATQVFTVLMGDTSGHADIQTHLVAIILVDAFVDTDALRKVKDLVIIGTLEAMRAKGIDVDAIPCIVESNDGEFWGERKRDPHDDRPLTKAEVGRALHKEVGSKNKDECLQIITDECKRVLNLDVDPKIFELDVEPPAGYQPRGDRDSAIPRTLAKLLDDTHKIATTSDDSDRALLALKIHKQALSAAYAHQNMIDSSINVNTCGAAEIKKAGIPHLTEGKHGHIVDAIKKGGPFKDGADFGKRVKGIGEKRGVSLYEGMRIRMRGAAYQAQHGGARKQMPLTKLRFFAACAMLPGRLDELAALPDAFEAQRMHLRGETVPEKLGGNFKGDNFYTPRYNRDINKVHISLQCHRHLIKAVRNAISAGQHDKATEGQKRLYRAYYHLALQPDAKHLISVKELKSSDKMSVASAQRWLSCDASDALARHAQLCTEPELKSDLENASRVALAWGAWDAALDVRGKSLEARRLGIKHLERHLLDLVTDPMYLGQHVAYASSQCVEMTIAVCQGYLHLENQLKTLRPAAYDVLKGRELCDDNSERLYSQMVACNGSPTATQVVRRLAVLQRELHKKQKADREWSYRGANSGITSEHKKERGSWNDLSEGRCQTFDSLRVRKKTNAKYFARPLGATSERPARGQGTGVRAWTGAKRGD